MTKVFLNSQSKAIDKLKKVKCGALFMDAGTGKTRVTLELIRNTETDLIIWFTPFQTKKNLKKEIDKWGGLDCEIIGIESLQNSDRIYLEIFQKLNKSKKAFIIIDESLKIKNIDAKRTKRIIEISKYCEYRLILNGTPLSKNLLDLYSQIYFLSPKILNISFAEFQNIFCEYIQIKQGGKIIKEFIKQYHNIDYLYLLIQPFIFESKLSLSIGQQHINIDYNLSDEEFENHNMLKDKYINNEVLMAKNNNIFLEITQKMQHNYSLSSEKFTIVDKLLSEIDKSKVLIYAKYIDTQKALKEYYKDIQIMSLQKHSFGLNLQSFNAIIFWDKTWDYAQREQVERRIFRTGQIENCIFYDLTGNVGLEKLINDNINRKLKMLEYFKSKTNKELKEVL